MSETSGSRGHDRSDYEEFWSTLPASVEHPVREPIIEALWWVGQPLSAIELVDVLDGSLSMWEAEYHLRVLDALGVAELSPVDTNRRTSRNDLFGDPYRLKNRDSA